MLAAGWLIVSLVLVTVEATGRQLAAVQTVVLLLGVANVSFEIIPRHDVRWNDAYQVAHQVIAHTSPEQTILVRSDDISGLYLTYWDDSRVVYVYWEAESWAGILSWVEETRDAPRVLVLDSDQRRAGWWDPLLESLEGLSGEAWARSVPDWRPEDSLVLELSLATEP